MTEHFNGTTWTEVPAPTLPANLAYNGWLREVTALGPGDVWAVGSANSFSSHTLALHFNGTSRQVIPSADPPTTANGVLESVAGTIPGQPLWATAPGTTIETVHG